MDTSTVVDLGRYALWMTALISAPLLLVALGVGLVIGIWRLASQYLGGIHPQYLPAHTHAVHLGQLVL
jgi:flagellar biosynthesis protein FliQ